ncbi:hypothetical protein YC2023_055124 [Brassica napus]
MDLVDQFKTSLPNDSLALTNNDSTQWSIGTATSVRAKFFVLNEKRTIREIIDSTLARVTMRIKFRNLREIVNIPSLVGLNTKFAHGKVGPIQLRNGLTHYIKK